MYIKTSCHNHYVKANYDYVKKNADVYTYDEEW